MYKIVILTTREVINDGFLTIKAANEWHDIWCDQFENDEDRPDVEFLYY